MKSDQLAELTLRDLFLAAEEEKVELTNTDRVGRTKFAELGYCLLRVKKAIFRFLGEENAHLS